MSTNPPDFTTPPRTDEQLSLFGTTTPEDEAARQRSVDVSNTVKQQVQGTDALLTTLISRMETLSSHVEKLPAVFSATTDHIRRSAEATEKLANASKKVADQQTRGQKAQANTTFSIKEMIQALQHGNIQGAIGELFQGLPGSAAIAANLEKSGRARMGVGTAWERWTGKGQVPMTAEEAAAAGVEPGTMRTVGRMAAAGGALRLGAAAFLESPAAVILGAYQAANMANYAQQQALQLGQLTGEGRGAGLAAGGIDLSLFGRHLQIGGEVGHLRANPFDLIDRQKAEEIVRSVRGSGFRGSEAVNTEEAIAGMINDLGLGVQDAMQIAIPAIKEAGMSTGELAAQMSTLDDTAKASRIGVSELASSISGLIQQLSTQSRAVARAGAPTTQNLLREFQGTLAGRNAGIFTALQTGTQREALAQLSGFAPFEAYTPEFSRNFQANFNRVLVQLAKAKPKGVGWNLYVHEMLLNPMYAQLFGSTPIPDIVDMLQTAWKGSDQGTNAQKFINQQASQNMARDAETQAKGVSDTFNQLMKRKEDPLKGPLGRMITGMMGKSDGVSRDLIRREGMKSEQEIASILMGLGLTKEQRRTILDPIVKAVKSGDRDLTQAALGYADKAIQQYQNQGALKVNVGVAFNPRDARMLKTLDIGAIQARRGERGTQGTEIH